MQKRLRAVDQFSQVSPLYVIYQTREIVSHQEIQTLKKGLRKRGGAGCFLLLTDFEVFRYLMKHSFEFLKWFLKPFITLREIQSKSSQNV